MKDATGKCVGVVAKSEGKQIQFNSKVVIDASGFVSVIAKGLGYVNQWKKFGAGAEFEVKTEKLEYDNWKT